MDFEQLGYFDYAVFTVLGLSTLIAFFRGFIASSLSFVTWFGGVAIAIIISPIIEPLLEEKISSPIIRYITSAAVSYVVVIVILSLISIPVRRFVYQFVNTYFDRALGFLFGLARGMLIICMAFISIIYTYGFINGKITRTELVAGKKNDAPEWLSNAQTYGFLKLSSQFLVEYIPDKVFNVAKEHAEAKKEKADEISPDRIGSSGLTLQHMDSLPSDISPERLEHLKRIVKETDLRELMKNPELNNSLLKDKGYSEKELKELQKTINKSQ